MGFAGSSLFSTLSFLSSRLGSLLRWSSAAPAVNGQSDTEPSGVTNNHFTNDTDGTLSVCGLVAGSYTVTESDGDMEVVGLVVNGNSLPPQTVYSFTWKAGQPAISILFR